MCLARVRAKVCILDSAQDGARPFKHLIANSLNFKQIKDIQQEEVLIAL